MKINPYIRISPLTEPRSLPSARAVAGAGAGRCARSPLKAADELPASTRRPIRFPGEHAEKPAPLPLHQIEGSGGIFSTLSAYIVNPPRDGEPVGRPSVGFAYVNLGSEKDLEALTITESPFKRLELGYGWDHLGLGDLPLALRTNAGLANYHAGRGSTAQLQRALPDSVGRRVRSEMDSGADRRRALQIQRRHQRGAQ